MGWGNQHPLALGDVASPLPHRGGRGCVVCVASSRRPTVETGETLLPHPVKLYGKQDEPAHHLLHDCRDMQYLCTASVHTTWQQCDFQAKNVNLCFFFSSRV